MAGVEKLSNEQISVATSDQNTKVQAFAGTGKSTSLLAYVKQHPKESILYLCFNKPNRVQFQERIRVAGHSNVSVSTTHAIAKKFIYGNRNVNIVGALSPRTISTVLSGRLAGIPPSMHMYLAHHGNKMLKAFCASKVKKIQNFDYQSQVSEDQTSFVSHYHNEIEGIAISLMQLMTEEQMPVLHDYYLKLFQVRGITLPFDTILFDEVQDCSPVMIDMVESQKSKNIYVGDPHQEIYAWRGAVSAFESLSMHCLHLSESFRYGPTIAKIAMHILNWKKDLLNQTIPAKIIGAGPNNSVKGRAYISRTTVGLLHEAIFYTVENPDIKIRFQGGLASYLTHEFGFTLLDVLGIYQGKPLSKHTRTIFLQGMSFSDLVEYASITEDNQLSAFVKLCEEYGNGLPAIIKGLEKAEISDMFQVVDITMSTAHRLKGVEFLEVVIGNDFYTREALLRRQLRGLTSVQVREEINLLYVAVTRAAKDLVIDQVYLS